MCQKLLESTLILDLPKAGACTLQGDSSLLEFRFYRPATTASTPNKTCQAWVGTLLPQAFATSTHPSFEAYGDLLQAQPLDKRRRGTTPIVCRFMNDAGISAESQIP